MSVINSLNNLNNPMFNKLLAHIGHKIETVAYGQGEPINASVECMDCNEVLYSEDKERGEVKDHEI